MKYSGTNTAESVQTSVITTSTLCIPARFSLTLKNLPLNNGDIYIAIYNSEGTFMNSPCAVRKVSREESESIINFHLTMGVYSVLVFQDQNGDGVLNRNTYGIPTEPWTTSANTGRTTGKPTWSETRFKIDELVDHLEIEF